MRILFAAVLALVFLSVSACSETDGSAAGTAMATASSPASSVSGQELPTVLVYKSPTCGCCNGWIEHLEAAGFAVDARDTRELMAIKVDAGVPTQLSSCHTAIVDGYVVEGHVPVEHVKSLVTDKPDVAGIAVPGMPIGSPGMEGPNPEPYRVFAFTRDGEASVYAEVDPR